MRRDASHSTATVKSKSWGLSTKNIFYLEFDENFAVVEVGVSKEPVEPPDDGEQVLSAGGWD